MERPIPTPRRSFNIETARQQYDNVTAAMTADAEEARRLGAIPLAEYLADRLEAAGRLLASLHDQLPELSDMEARHASEAAELFRREAGRQIGTADAKEAHANEKARIAALYSERYFRSQVTALEATASGTASRLRQILEPYPKERGVALDRTRQLAAMRAGLGTERAGRMQYTGFSLGDVRAAAREQGSKASPDDARWWPLVEAVALREHRAELGALGPADARCAASVEDIAAIFAVRRKAYEQTQQSKVAQAERLAAEAAEASAALNGGA